MLVTITYIISCVSFVGALAFLCVMYVKHKRWERAQTSLIYEVLLSINAKLPNANE